MSKTLFSVKSSLYVTDTLITSIEVTPNYWPKVFNPIPCGSSEPTTNPNNTNSNFNIIGGTWQRGFLCLYIVI